MKKRAVAAAVLLAVIALAAWQLPLEELIRSLQGWVSQHRAFAFLAVTGAMVLAMVLMLPTSVTMMLAGFLLGLAQGLAAVWLAGLVASTASFLIGRTIARPWIERKLRRRSLFVGIDRAIQRRGLLIVLLSRLVLVLPYPALNYSLGLTGVRLRDFMLGTNLGMVPAMLLFVYLGTSFSDLAALVRGDLELETGESLLAIAVGVVTVLAVLLISYVAGRAFRAEMSKAQEPL